MIEMENSVIKKKYEDTLYAKTFWKQYKEMLLIYFMANIEHYPSIHIVIWLKTSIEPIIPKCHQHILTCFTSIKG